jgi:hypothetical protein
MIKITKKQAFERIAEHILDCENGEYESYLTYCEDNGYNPVNIKGKNQSFHVYALALIALDCKFPID